jgi:hypothetical protein
MKQENEISWRKKEPIEKYIPMDEEEDREEEEEEEELEEDEGI